MRFSHRCAGENKENAGKKAGIRLPQDSNQVCHKFKKKFKKLL